MQQNMILREINHGDHEWLVELHNDPEVLKNLTNPNPITLNQHLSWWEKISKDNSQKRKIFEINSERVGFTKFYNIDFTNRNCILGADIHKNFRGKGYAKFMWSLMLDYCKEIGLHRVSLTTAEYNLIGQRVYKNLGFIEEGKLISSLYRDEKFFDQICMYKIL
jgi:RimJ/RimL family protein N-acetyltransferase